jgi:translation initiation factor 3 subunit D
VNPRDNSKHVILAVGTYKPKDFAAQMNVQLTNAWGVVRAIVDVCRKRPDGKYVLVKVHLCKNEADYRIPTSRFFDFTRFHRMMSSLMDMRKRIKLTWKDLR